MFDIAPVDGIGELVDDGIDGIDGVGREVFVDGVEQAFLRAPDTPQSIGVKLSEFAAFTMMAVSLHNK